MDWELSIKGLQEAQKANLKLIAAMKPDGALGDAIRVGTIAAQRYAVIETHVDTGTLRASHRISVSGLTGLVFIDPSARNPRTHQLAAQYGPYEEARGDSHAFYGNTVEKYSRNITDQAIAAFVAGIQK
jgi:hypothetical protein